jgi:SAM-dependent methyltransferase
MQTTTPRDLSPISERLQSIADRVLGAADLGLDPWFYSYCGSVGDPRGAARYVRFHADLLELARAGDDRPVIIDAGCGFGFTMIAHALLGARQVRGVELNRNMVSSVEAYLPLLPDDVSSRLEVVQGSVAAMPYEDASADIVLSLEAISHYLDVDAFIDEAFRVLRPGGLLIIADGNNALNPVVRRRTARIWAAVETGPANQTVHGHVLGEPYVEVRRRLVEEHFPAIDAPSRREIARRTAGFTEPQVIAAAREYIETGTLPDSVYRRGRLATAPDGTAMERLFSPFALARTLGRRGFRARAYGYWGGAGGSQSIRAVNRILTALSPIAMPTAPSFRVVGRKAAL